MWTTVLTTMSKGKITGVPIGAPHASFLEEKCTTLPEYCRAWRLIAGIKQSEIAERVGVDRSSISRFESGKLHSNKVISGYAGMGMPLPYDLVVQYLTNGGGD